MRSQRYLIQRAVNSSMVILLAIVAVCPAATVQEVEPACDWGYGQPHKMHWAQWPDYSALGLDIEAVSATLADDFLCTATGPIRDVHLWGSFMGDVLPESGPGSLSFDVAFYSDVPARGDSPSRPGQRLWSRTFGPGQYSVKATHDGFQCWYDPSTGIYKPDDHRQGFQYDFCIQDRSFVQEEGTVYWLTVRVKMPDNSKALFGLKTTLSRFHWNDDGVRGQGTGWAPMSYPKEHEDRGNTLDLAFVITGGGDVRPSHDLGDAPDSSNSLPGQQMTAYPTGVSANFPTVYRAGSPPYGPIHLDPEGFVHLGNAVSLEDEADLGFDIDPTNNLDPAANAADLDAADDGVVLPAVLPDCQKGTLAYSVTVTEPVHRTVYVNVWFDWNRDGDWDDVMTCPSGSKAFEWAVQNQTIQINGPGLLALTSPAFMCWHPPVSADPDPLWMRIMIAEQPWTQPAITLIGVGGSGPAEGYQYGETEDYYLYPRKSGGPQEYDWGDAPDAVASPRYPTLRSSNGAYHVIAGPWLGDVNDRPDRDSDGQPDPNALGDVWDVNAMALGLAYDDEDGVSVPPLVAGQTVDITLEVRGGGGIVQGWIDFDANGEWQSSEEVFNTFLPNGVHNLAVKVPDIAMQGWTFARFRISRQGGLAPEGQGADGEVEDYKVWIWRLPSQTKWVQLPDTTPNGIDVCVDSNDGKIRHVADDFKCTTAGKITQVTVWGSWRDDKAGKIKKVHVEIHPDDPVGSLGSDPGNRYSKPGPEVLWSKDFGPGQFFAKLYHRVYSPGEWWRDFKISNLKFQISDKAGGDTQIWQIDLPIDPNQAFQQTGSEAKPVIYWLHVWVDTEVGRFGWKTRRWPDHFMDDAVWDTGGGLPRLWKELRYQRPHPYYGLDKDSLDMAFLLVSTPWSEYPTCQPTCITTCPPVDTTCPAVLTTCPPIQTQCPVVNTQCPSSDTKCPVVDTRCPSAPTQCPVVDTQCPSPETKCPVVDTRCPVQSTRCPMVQTQCPPAVQTYCQVVQTQCPVVGTQCPVIQTQCPPVNTQCPVSDTKCPVVLTQCPTQQTQCPPVQTQCPTVDTKCPPADTKCPVVQTQCPPVLTQCPAPPTECSTVPTQCPGGPTQCPPVPTYCPPIQTQCPGGPTSCPPVQTECPTVQTQCPPVQPTQCPVLQTQCPTQPTQCPPVRTQCPPVSTQCPITCQLGITPAPAYLATEPPCPVIEADCPSL